MMIVTLVVIYYLMEIYASTVCNSLEFSYVLRKRFFNTPECGIVHRPCWWEYAQNNYSSSVAVLFFVFYFVTHFLLEFCIMVNIRCSTDWKVPRNFWSMQQKFGPAIIIIINESTLILFLLFLCFKCNEIKVRIHSVIKWILLQRDTQVLYTVNDSIRLGNNNSFLMSKPQKWPH